MDEKEEEILESLKEAANVKEIKMDDEELGVNQISKDWNNSLIVMEKRLQLKRGE